MPAKGSRKGNRIEIRGNQASVFVVHGDGSTDEILIDSADVPLVSPYTWRTNADGYAQSGELNCMMHVLIMKPPPGMVVDHIHHNRLDNRRSELRVVPQSVNQHNRGRKPRNVQFEKQIGRWRVRFCVNWKTQSFGTYPTLEEAEAVAASVREKLIRGEAIVGFHNPGSKSHKSFPSHSKPATRTASGQNRPNRIEVGESFATIYIRHKGKELPCLVDLADLPLVKDYTWTRFSDGYAFSAKLRKMMHVFLLNPPKGMTVDHIHHDNLDNRRSELRVVTQSLNSRNRKKPAKNVFNYPTRDGRIRWRVLFCVNYKQLSFGIYDTEEEAAAVAAKVREKLLRGDPVAGNPTEYRVRIPAGQKRPPLIP